MAVDSGPTPPRPASVREALERRAARFVHRKRIPMRNTAGVVSFTFDDVPRSACRAGRDLLEAHDCAGTYYACGGLTDRHGATGEPFHSREDLGGLAQNGHEVACHGFAHLPYQQRDLAAVGADLDREAAFFAELGRDVQPANFAYPYGQVSPALKRLAGERFVSARGIRPGVNAGRVDLALLDAVPLFSSTLTEAAVAEWIERAERRRGWLLFFTHSVSDDPGPSGATPALLEFAVAHAARSGCSVLTVSHALGRIAFRSS
ncbi:MAG: polysaccharide deacetylase family protein [Planctomycetota bacterium]|jgi:peptidoglycan/xylan/chitin deacetylase (PgdA/CDA1 family)|nr:polysaccharide deacetylase family protein [Planctomycetota bacterium]MDP6990497.1 polysaccharide deacetylase family protein [Planctomycetota bacterium]